MTVDAFAGNTPVRPTFTSTLQAIAVAIRNAPSTCATATYTINLVPPDFSVAIAFAFPTVTVGQSATATTTPLNRLHSV
jgi:hypothetical protein